MAREYGGSIFQPTGKTHLYMKFYDPLEKRIVKKVTPFVPGEEDRAREFLAAAKAAFGAQATVEQYGRKWLDQRKVQGLADAVNGNDRQRMETHVFPVIGTKQLDEVEPQEIVDLLKKMQAAGLAQRTVRNVHALIRTMYRDATFDKTCLTNPAATFFFKARLGEIHDKNPGWRADAYFSLGELQRLVTSPAVPLDRRVLYALTGLAGMRPGEACGLRWNRIQEKKPLPRIVIAKSYARLTKKRNERWAPVLPALQELLKQWHTLWPSVFGRAVTPDDLVIPVTPYDDKGPRCEVGSIRNRSYNRYRIVVDLAAIGLRHRRGYDLRRTFITLAGSGGADPQKLAWGTHAPPGDTMSLYTSRQWTTLCEQYSCLKVSLTAPAPEAFTPFEFEDAAAAPLFG